MCADSQAIARDDEEYALPCVEALLAGTLALMTGVAQAAPGSAHVGPLAAKIIVNLGALADHPALSQSMRRMLMHLRPRWQPVALQAATGEGSPSDRTLWLRSPATLQ